MAIEKIVGDGAPSPDKVGDAFNKVNNAFDEIITGATFNPSNSTLSLNQFDGSTIDVVVSGTISTASTTSSTVTRRTNGSSIDIEATIDISGETTGETITLIPQNFLNKRFFKLDSLLVLITRVDDANNHVGELAFTNLIRNSIDQPRLFVKNNLLHEFEFIDEMVGSDDPFVKSIQTDLTGIYYLENENSSVTLPDISLADMSVKHIGENYTINGQIKLYIKGILL